MLERVRVVLHRPQSAENLGAAARAMKNFGLGRLSVVAPASWAGAPRSGGPGTAREDVLLRAARLARRAGDVLAAVEVHADLAGALSAATWTCGTTSRPVSGRPRLSPRQLAEELWRRSAAAEVAVVFGEERRGLSDAELTLCQAVCTIPTHPGYESMNLAQAVVVICYELGLAAAGPSQASPRPAPARHATVEALWGLARAVLSEVGYLNPQNPEAILADLRHLLAHADPAQREVELLAGALRAIERRLRHPPR
ncbi:MAG TPA: TrmH family RNA methyltransferase [Anaeromyxobacter sp.]|nr:TrmH family RNA methyltransferase [Anaeromyxobacter sp.]